jgi:hypothetical protein
MAWRCPSHRSGCTRKAAALPAPGLRREDHKRHDQDESDRSSEIALAPGPPDNVPIDRRSQYRSDQTPENQSEKGSDKPGDSQQHKDDQGDKAAILEPYSALFALIHDSLSSSVVQSLPAIYHIADTIWPRSPHLPISTDFTALTRDRVRQAGFSLSSCANRGSTFEENPLPHEQAHPY